MMPGSFSFGGGLRRLRGVFGCVTSARDALLVLALATTLPVWDARAADPQPPFRTLVSAGRATGRRRAAAGLRSAKIEPGGSVQLVFGVECYGLSGNSRRRHRHPERLGDPGDPRAERHPRAEPGEDVRAALDRHGVRRRRHRPAGLPPDRRRPRSGLRHLQGLGARTSRSIAPAAVPPGSRPPGRARPSASCRPARARRSPAGGTTPSGCGSRSSSRPARASRGGRSRRPIPAAAPTRATSRDRSSNNSIRSRAARGRLRLSTRGARIMSGGRPARSPTTVREAVRLVSSTIPQQMVINCPTDKLDHKYGPVNTLKYRITGVAVSSVRAGHSKTELYPAPAGAAADAGPAREGPLASPSPAPGRPSARGRPPRATRGRSRRRPSSWSASTGCRSPTRTRPTPTPARSTT